MCALTEWLLQQIGADERTAHDEARRQSAWQRELDVVITGRAAPSTVFVDFAEPGMPGDPARVLAECAAKRELVAMHFRIDAPTGFTCREYEGRPDAEPMAEWPCRILRLLAEPYADRPGYRPRWRP